MSRLGITLFAIFSLACVETQAGWQRLGNAPHSTRALAVSANGSIVGFTADRKEQTVFSIAPSGRLTTAPLEAAPQFYGYAHDVSGTRLCVPLPSNGATSLVCFDQSLRRVDAAPLFVPMTSGAIAQNDRAVWIVDPSGTAAAKRMSLVRLQRTSEGWSPSERREPPLCNASSAELQCGEVEIHPTDRDGVAVVPLLGTFDGERLHYPTLGIWNTTSGVVKHVSTPSLPVPSALVAEYRRIDNLKLRLVYRSAASRRGKIAVIPALPAADAEGIKHDQLWLYDGAATWQRITAPGQINAVAFLGEDPIVVTKEGALLRWRR